MNIQCPLCVPYKNARRYLVEENWEKEGRIRGQNAEMINPNVKKHSSFSHWPVDEEQAMWVLSWDSNLEPSRFCICILAYISGRFIWNDFMQNSLEDGQRAKEAFEES